ncbi:MAG TPA: nuclear transport factor 2 family protein [Pyrinomonadaceae bacterium]|nr:nuclear transport factor 2 family protein [Pyrinomonadaceae bacterium]
MRKLAIAMTAFLFLGFGALSVSHAQLRPNRPGVGPRRPVRPGVAPPVQAKPQRDEEVLEALVREWANAVVHRDLDKLDRIQANDFKGSAQGKDFNKRMLREALQTRAMEVAAWTIEDVKVRVTGNTALVTGRSTLSNAKFMGQDYSGEYEWSDRFVRQRDGTWRAVSSHAKLVKK